MRQPPILIGQAAAKNGAPRALFPADPNSAGGRLMRMSGLSMNHFLNEFESFNTIEWFPGRNARGDAFDIREGVLEAHRHMQERDLFTRVCIFVGKANAKCYDWGNQGMPRWPFQWREQLAGGSWAWIPHSSGAVKFWNDKNQRDRVPRLFLEALEKAGGSASARRSLEKILV